MIWRLGTLFDAIRSPEMCRTWAGLDFEAINNPVANQELHDSSSSRQILKQRMAAGNSSLRRVSREQTYRDISGRLSDSGYFRSSKNPLGSSESFVRIAFSWERLCIRVESMRISSCTYSFFIVKHCMPHGDKLWTDPRIWFFFLILYLFFYFSFSCWSGAMWVVSKSFYGGGVLARHPQHQSPTEELKTERNRYFHLWMEEGAPFIRWEISL